MVQQQQQQQQQWLPQKVLRLFYNILKFFFILFGSVSCEHLVLLYFTYIFFNTTTGRKFDGINRAAHTHIYNTLIFDCVSQTNYEPELFPYDYSDKDNENSRNHNVFVVAFVFISVQYCSFLVWISQIYAQFMCFTTNDCSKSISALSLFVRMNFAS